MFDRYGPRVPAVVISPWCPQNLIEHRQLEHSFIPATIEQLFGLGPLTNRDTEAVGLQTLATLGHAAQRDDANTGRPLPPLEPGGPVPGTPAGVLRHDGEFGGRVDRRQSAGGGGRRTGRRGFAAGGAGRINIGA